MCGRFVLYSLSPVLEGYFNAQPPGFELSANYNVSPTQEIPVIIQRDGTRQFTKRHWGLVPFWAKDISMGARMINARVETLASKPAFKAALRHRRCLIPANGFYEWADMSGRKQPFYFHLSSGEPMAFAGLWEVWKPQGGRSRVGNPQVEHYHHHRSQRVGQGHSRQDAADLETGGIRLLAGSRKQGPRQNRGPVEGHACEGS